jgi:nucleobase:cation symporter-1, NCS1 family
LAVVASIGGELAGGTMDTADFVSYIIFLVLCMPLIWFSPERFRKAFMAGSFILLITVPVLFIWSMFSAGGGGALLSDTSSISGVKQAK